VHRKVAKLFNHCLIVAGMTGPRVKLYVSKALKGEDELLHQAVS
jgi:hypothetical protein